jgi:ABC-2 type transport system permease protein
VTYTRYELVRAFRNRRFFFFSLGFPLILYFVIAGPNKHAQNFGGTGLSAPLYYMVGLASFGTMMATISTGGRIATERQAGWTRQLRISPLSSFAYFRTKLIVAYAIAMLTMLVLFLAGTSLGVHLPAGRLLGMLGLMLCGLAPFAALGILVGHVSNTEAVGPLIGGIVSLLALVSGTWFPVQHGFLHDLGQALPSYWLVQASHVAEHGHGWTGLGWGVVAGWLAVLSVAARWAYRRDTGRV